MVAYRFLSSAIGSLVFLNDNIYYLIPIFFPVKPYWGQYRHRIRSAFNLPSSIGVTDNAIRMAFKLVKL